MVHRLLLLRHAKSSWDEPSLADHERPLAKRGRKAAARVGEYLRAADLTPDLVVCSTARRTRQTWKRLALEGPEVRLEDAMYGATAGELAGLAVELPETAKSVLFIGHNPGISELVRLLAAQHGVGELTTGAMCSLALTTDKWSIAAAALVTEVQSEAPQPSLFGLWA